MNLYQTPNSLDYNACITDNFEILQLMVFNLCKITASYKVLQIRDRIMIRHGTGAPTKYIWRCL